MKAKKKKRKQPFKFNINMAKFDESEDFCAKKFPKQKGMKTLSFTLAGRLRRM